MGHRSESYFCDICGEDCTLYFRHANPENEIRITWLVAAHLCKTCNKKHRKGIERDIENFLDKMIVRYDIKFERRR